jgi:hypothetical protein
MMRRTIAPLPFFLLVLALGATPVVAQDMNDLAGTWLIDSWTSADGEVTEDVQRGVFLFTIERDDGGSYMMFFVNQAEDRALFGEDEPTDAQKAAAYDEFTANAGRLTVEGNTFTFEAWMAKNPNYMDGWPDNDRTVEWAVSEGVLTVTFENGNKATLRRPEG